MTRRVMVVLSLLALGAVACSEDVAAPNIPPTSAKGAPAAAQAAVDGGAADGDVLPPKIDFQEAEFSESERSRDPFRNYAEMFVEEARNKVKSQRDVVLDQYAVDELKLVGIVTGIHPAKAMLVDPSGKGHVVQRGQFVGRPEVVQTGTGTASYEINWRIDRIRDGDIVLVREDPQNPDVPSATRVIALRQETGEEAVR